MICYDVTNRCGSELIRPHYDCSPHYPNPGEDSLPMTPHCQCISGYPARFVLYQAGCCRAPPIPISCIIFFIITCSIHSCVSKIPDPCDILKYFQQMWTNINNFWYRESLINLSFYGTKLACDIGQYRVRA